MSDHPCSKEREGYPIGDPGQKKGSELPISIISHGTLTMYGQTPGDNSHQSPSHHLIIDRRSVRRDDEESADNFK